MIDCTNACEKKRANTASTISRKTTGPSNTITKQRSMSLVNKARHSDTTVGPWTSTLLRRVDPRRVLMAHRRVSTASIVANQDTTLGTVDSRRNQRHGSQCLATDDLKPLLLVSTLQVQSERLLPLATPKVSSRMQWMKPTDAVTYSRMISTKENSPQTGTRTLRFPTPRLSQASPCRGRPAIGTRSMLSGRNH